MWNEHLICSLFMINCFGHWFRQEKHTQKEVKERERDRDTWNIQICIASTSIKHKLLSSHWCEWCFFPYPYCQSRLAYKANSYSTTVSHGLFYFGIFSVLSDKRARESEHKPRNRIKNKIQEKCLAIIIIIISVNMEHHIENDKWISMNYVAHCHLTRI